MSYRAFKRLLGETSLERKCRFLFGAFILFLITGSFLLYARQTEGLARKQISTTWRLANAPVEEQLPDGRWRAYCPDHPDIKEGVAATREEARQEVRRAIERYLDGATEDEMHVNRAILFSTALVTALLIMSGSYIIVRYVIVKPVKHLKEVSDAIAAGELNVRSEIQTGDEFEDLSHAFNRMLRNLVSMQDRLRKVNADLDRKVDELAHANLALYESNRLKSDFLATMSHELRTPLNSILGFSDVLLSSNQLNDKQQRWVSNIKSSGERLLGLINDILDLAKIEAGKMQVRLSEFSVYDVCEGLLTMFRPLAEKKNIDLRGQLEAGIPVLRQDVGKLQQLLSNLLSNAIKFTPEGGRVLLRAEADPMYVVLTITDTGVGIAAEEQELVFEKFRQAGNPLTREHAGTGLGLSIVKELSKLLGGEVALQSELGRGSTFTVRLPLQLSEEPRLEFDLAGEGVDLSKAQRVDVRLYAGAVPPAAPTRVEAHETRLDTVPEPVPPIVPADR
jgi:signal transduction histidine kinase